MEYRILCVPDVSEDSFALWFSEAAEEKQQRLLQMRHEADRRRSLCADHLARQMLSEITGIARSALKLLRDDRGKPYLEGNALHFNLSHAGDFAVCAVDTSPVGIDIEVPRVIRPALCRKVCDPAEMAFVHPKGEFSSDRFLQLWTAKEAYLKKSGLGIMRNLRSVCLVKEGALAYPEPAKGLFLAGERYYLSIAYE